MLLFNLLHTALIITFLTYKEVPSLVGLVVNAFDDASFQERQRKVGLWEFKASLVHIQSSRTARTVIDGQTKPTTATENLLFPNY